MTVDPVVGEADAATVELAPEASTRDGAFTVVAKASFGGMVTVVVTLVGSTEGLAGAN